MLFGRSRRAMPVKPFPSKGASTALGAGMCLGGSLKRVLYLAKRCFKECVLVGGEQEPNANDISRRALIPECFMLVESIWDDPSKVGKIKKTRVTVNVKCVLMHFYTVLAAVFHFSISSFNTFKTGFSSPCSGSCFAPGRLSSCIINNSVPFSFSVNLYSISK